MGDLEVRAFERETHRREGVRRNEPLQLIFIDTQIYSDGWEGNRDSSSIRSLHQRKSASRVDTPRNATPLTLIIIAPAQVSTRNTLLTVLLPVEGCGNGEPPSLTLYVLFASSPLRFMVSPSMVGGVSVSSTHGVGVIKSLVGETASPGCWCISINDPRV